MPKKIEQLIAQDAANTITLHGVQTHNLKNIDITLPKNKLITITGVSGSGKSSLAFHTIYKEGQFRYIESLSAYLRQFFNLGARPDIESSSGLSPAIAIEQNKSIGNSRSTVGTLTEIDDYLRLLYAKTGKPYSYGTGAPMEAQTIASIVDEIQKTYNKDKIYLLKESKELKTKEEFDKFIKNNRVKVEKGKGFTRYLLTSLDQKEGLEPIEFFYLETPKIPEKYFPVKLYGIFDRVTVEEKKKLRLKEDIIKILAEEKKFGVRTENGEIKRYTDKNYCPVSNIEYPDFTSQHFSFNRAEGACPICHGIGEVLQVDLDKVIDANSPYMKAILPWRDSRLGQTVLLKLAQKYSMDQDKLWKDLPEWFRQTVIEGDNELLRVAIAGKFTSMKYQGIEEILKDQYQQGLLTVDFQAMLDMQKCAACQGAKLRKESLHVFLTIPKSKVKKSLKIEDMPQFHETAVDNFPDKLYKRNIAELQTLTISELVAFLHLYKDAAKKNIVLIERIINPLLDRAETIEKLGLGYISINRQVGTLSGGELQRMRLAKQLGNKLTGIIYVLDEPTIGLNDEEIRKTIKSIESLKELGNTIIVVEHHEEFIKASDWITEIGPGAGDFGGSVVFNGEYKEFIKQKTLTADYINKKKETRIEFEHSPQEQRIKVKKAKKYNLQNIDVNIQLGSFTIITGHSGAGKTTLMYTTLYRFLQEKQKFVQSYIRLQLLKQGMSREEIITAPVMKKEEYEHYENVAIQEFHEEVGVESIRGHERIDQVVYVDQTSIGKTPRSCPSTFVGVFDNIRTLFSGVNEAKYLGFNSGHFSFNSSKGACPECKGYGYKKIELQFLPDTYIPCELCKGKRYKTEILDIRRRGKNISEILDMYVEDALEFFKEMGHISHDLQLMVDIGLGYLKMGQPAHTLSGGESQRLKLVKHLLKSYKGHTLYFLDEPTVGLHPDDIGRLLQVLKKFLDEGATILMIEHDKSLLKFADNVIELKDGAIVKK